MQETIHATKRETTPLVASLTHVFSSQPRLEHMLIGALSFITMGDYTRLAQDRGSSEEGEAFVQKGPVLDDTVPRPRLASLSIFAVSVVAFLLGILSTHLVSYIHGSLSRTQRDRPKVLVQCMFWTLGDTRICPC
jgi:hypothetical protein